MVPIQEHAPLNPVMRLALAILLSVALITGCGKTSPQEVAGDVKKSVGDVNQKKTSKEAADFSRDFAALCRWCEQSVTAIRNETKANPIRGKELAESKLAFLRRELDSQQPRWRVRVNQLDEGGNVMVGAFHRIKREASDNQGRFIYDDAMLSVKMQPPEPTSGEDMAHDPIYRVKNVPRQTLRNLTVGKEATLSGTILSVDYFNFFTITLADATLQE